MRRLLLLILGANLSLMRGETPPTRPAAPARWIAVQREGRMRETPQPLILYVGAGDLTDAASVVGETDSAAALDPTLVASIDMWVETHVRDGNGGDPFLKVLRGTGKSTLESTSLSLAQSRLFFVALTRDLRLPQAAQSAATAFQKSAGL